MNGWRYTIVVGGATFLAAGCDSASATARDGGGGNPGTGAGGAAGAPAHDAAVDQRFWDGGGAEGAIHVAWMLETAGGSSTDCVSASTNNIDVAFTNASQVQVLLQTDYCVDMKETVGGFAPGNYAIQLSLHSTKDSSIVATATGTATVTADAVADAGTLTLKLAGP